MSFFKNVKSLLKLTVSKLFLQYLQSRHKIVLLGDGRSGTTWASDVLNFDNRFLNIIEPFHGRRKLKLSDDRLYPTRNDLDQWSIKSIPSGRFIFNRKLFSDLKRRQIIPHLGTITKDVSAHTIIPQVFTRKSSNAYIIRNPISVALSKEKYGDWHSVADLNRLLEYSPELQAIGTSCQIDGLISTKFLEYIFAWSLLNRIALKEMENYGFPVVFYENLLRNPESAFEELFQFAGIKARFACNRLDILKSIKQKSRTTVAQNMISANANQDRPWAEKISSDQILSAYKILKRFDLYEIYQDSIIPKISRDDLEKITSRWK